MFMNVYIPPIPLNKSHKYGPLTVLFDVSASMEEVEDLLESIHDCINTTCAKYNIQRTTLVVNNELKAENLPKTYGGGCFLKLALDKIDNYCPILLVTDGFITDSNEVKEILKKKGKNERKNRISILGVGKCFDAAFCEWVITHKKGTLHRIVSHKKEFVD
eukprot:UN29641